MQKVLATIGSKLIIIVSAIALIFLASTSIAAADRTNPSGTGYGKDQCKNGGWRDFTGPPGPFKNQGDCVSFFATGGRNPGNGQ